MWKPYRPVGRHHWCRSRPDERTFTVRSEIIKPIRSSWDSTATGCAAGKSPILRPSNVVETSLCVPSSQACRYDRINDTIHRGNATISSVRDEITWSAGEHEIIQTRQSGSNSTSVWGNSHDIARYEIFLDTAEWRPHVRSVYIYCSVRVRPLKRYGFARPRVGYLFTPERLNYYG